MKYHNYLENLFGSKVKIKLTRTLYKFKDRSFTLSELSRYSGVTRQGIIKALDDLKGMNLIKLERIGNSIVIRLNRNEFINNILKIYELEKNTLNKLIEVIKSYFKDKKIISLVLFGSIAKGEENFNSDIDLLIITKNKKLASQISEKCNLKIIDKFGNVLMPYILNENEFKKSNIREDVIKNHILIKGEGLKWKQNQLIGT